jgi:L-methionine (R)-S-oxide reductase
MLESNISAGLLSDLEHLGQSDGPLAGCLETALEKVLRAFDCQAGTVHGLDSSSGMLCLRVCRGIPDTMLARIQLIPLGKGMAGIAAERREAVQVCNLQTDRSGVARPAAKETRMEGAIAVPILEGGQLRGTLGVAKPVAYEFSAAESELLMQAAAKLGKLLAGSSATLTRSAGEHLADAS